MRLRTLKKLSKQAAIVLEKHYGEKVFLAERGENHHGLGISCHCPKKGLWKCDCQNHPLKGTPMVGAMSGYYEPEWDERTAWEQLHELVLWGDKPKPMTEQEWLQTMRIARVTKADQDGLARWLEDELQQTAAKTMTTPSTTQTPEARGR